MTFINRMIKQAKTAPPAEFTIRPNQVNALAEYMLGSMAETPTKYLRLYVRNQLLLGRCKLFNIPIRVIGEHINEHDPLRL